MRNWVALALLLVATPAAGQVSGNIAGKIVVMGVGPSVRLSQVGSGPANPSTAYLAFDLDTTETADDATQPCCVKVPVTPTPEAAAAMKYLMHGETSNVFPMVRVISGITCTAMGGCRTPVLGTILPETLQGGTFTVSLSREALPKFHESAPSAPVTFTTLNSGGPPPPPPPPPPGTVFVGTDTMTRGAWPGVYGTQGSVVVSKPAIGLTVTSTGPVFTWAAATTDTRALITPTGRVAAAWYDNKTLSITVTPPDTLVHKVSLYLLDWDLKSRIEKIELLQGGALLDTRTAATFSQGVYYSWSGLSGPLQFRITNLEEAPVVVSGVFLDPVGATPQPPPPPPAITCPYTAPGANVVQQRPLGDVIAGVNQIATQATRWPLLLSWGFKITAEPLTKTTVMITATCVGPK